MHDWANHIFRAQKHKGWKYCKSPSYMGNKGFLSRKREKLKMKLVGEKNRKFSQFSWTEQLQIIIIIITNMAFASPPLILAGPLSLGRTVGHLETPSQKLTVKNGENVWQGQQAIAWNGMQRSQTQGWEEQVYPRMSFPQQTIGLLEVKPASCSFSSLKRSGK